MSPIISEKKSAGTPSSSTTPNVAHLTNDDMFLPTYEQHVNENMRKFNEPEGQAKAKHIEQFDIEKQKPTKRRVRYWAILIILALISIGMIAVLCQWFVGGFNKHQEEVKVSVGSNGIATPTATETDFATTQKPAGLETRALVTVTAPVVTVTDILTIIQTTPTQVVTQTTTISQAEISTPAEVSTPTVTATVSFIPPVTMLSSSDSDAAVSSSIAADHSRLSELLVNPLPTGPSEPDPTTLISVTTTAVTVIAKSPWPSITAAPRVNPMCGVPGESC